MTDTLQHNQRILDVETHDGDYSLFIKVGNLNWKQNRMRCKGYTILCLT